MGQANTRTRIYLWKTCGQPQKKVYRDRFRQENGRRYARSKHKRSGEPLVEPISNGLSIVCTQGRGEGVPLSGPGAGIGGYEDSSTYPITRTILTFSLLFDQFTQPWSDESLSKPLNRGMAALKWGGVYLPLGTI